MKSILFLILMSLSAIGVADKEVFCSQSLSEQIPGDEILGVYINEQGDRKMEIYKKEKLYFGKIIYDQQGKIKNGTTILFNLNYANNLYKGKIYLPVKKQNGNVSIKLKGNIMEVEVSKGFFREKKSWTKI